MAKFVVNKSFPPSIDFADLEVEADHIDYRIDDFIRFISSNNQTVLVLKRNQVYSITQVD